MKRILAFLLVFALTNTEHIYAQAETSPSALSSESEKPEVLFNNALNESRLENYQKAIQDFDQALFLRANS